MLERYSRMRICLDIARLHLQNKLDGNFDGYALVQKYAKYAEEKYGGGANDKRRVAENTNT